MERLALNVYNERQFRLTNRDTVGGDLELALADKDGAVDPGVLRVGGGLEDGCCLLWYPSAVCVSLPSLLLSHRF